MLLDLEVAPSSGTSGVYNAPQAPTSNGLFAMEVRLTWALGGYATRTAYGAGCSIPALALGSDFPVLGTSATLTTTNVSNVLPVTFLFFGSGQ